MLHACVQRFDVTENLKILAKFLASKRCLGAPSGSKADMSTRPRFQKLDTEGGWEPAKALFSSPILL
jgi:hypothetical protein